MEDRTAKTFLSLGIQSWGQSDEERKRATDDYLRGAGFDLHGDRKDADAWLKGVIDEMPWGKFECEVEHLEAALAKRRSI